MYLLLDLIVRILNVMNLNNMIKFIIFVPPWYFIVIKQEKVDAIKAKFPNLDLTYSIGGQISFDVFPRGIFYT